MRVSDTRRIVSRFLLGFGIFSTLLALGVFAVPFIAAVSGSYEGGEQAIGSFFLYLLLAFPAFLFIVASILVREWREARAGYITLACLFGIPLLTFLAALIHAGYDSFRHKSAA